MVGNQGGAGPADARRGQSRLTQSVRTAYDAAAGEWDGGPGRMYADLAAALGAEAGVPVAGRRVLDLGAGTGAAGAAALAAGAAGVVAVDVAPAMLRRCPPGLRPVVADAAALPLRAGSFDLAVAAFSLGHLDDIPGGLAEARRVCAALTASAFTPGWSHPAKQAVDDVLTAFGYQVPDWYQKFKRETEPRAADARWLAEAATAAGFARVRVRTVLVATAVATPPQLASWRLGMAHVAPFLAGLSPARRDRLTEAAEAAVSRAVLAQGGPLEVPMLVLTASST
jgi:ubiquinone/menaquinone biosynthesis C-methylase UbiE